VAGRHVFGELVDEVASALVVVPQVMVRIDDRQVGLERFFLRELRPRVQLFAVAVCVACEFVRLVHGSSSSTRGVRSLPHHFCWNSTS
jgi:hypothetical protein